MEVRFFSLNEMKKISIPEFYNSPSWISVICKTYKLKCLPLAVFDGEELINLVPFILIESKFFGNKLVSLPYCDYGGPVFEDVGSFELILQELDKISEELKIDYVEIRTRYDIFKPHFLPARSCVVKYPTFTLKIKPPEEFFWSLNKKVRNCIRKGEKCGVEVVEEANLQSFYGLYLKTSKKLGTPPHSFEFFENIFKHLKKNFKLLFAKYRNREIAASIFFTHNKRIYYWKNVSDKKFLHLKPNDLMIYEMVKWGFANGYEFLDLGRADPRSGTFFFKRKWGGKMETVNNIYIFYKTNEIPDPHSLKFKILRRLWSTLPLFMMRRLGPSLRKNFP